MGAKQKRLVKIVALLYVIFVLYPASVGPALWWCHTIEGPPMAGPEGPLTRTAAIVYSPIQLAMEIDSVEHFMLDYVDSFVRY